MTDIDLDNYYEFDDIFLNVDKLYYSNGKLIKKQNYKHPKDGIFKAYYEDKKICLEITFAANKKNGAANYYNKETQKICWTNYYTNDKLDGVCKSFYSDGKIKREETFIMGKKEGIERKYDENGNILQEMMYKQNARHGFARQYYSNGQIEHETQFINDKQEGVSRKYYESGKLKLEDWWKNDKPHGKHIGYHENGNISATTELQNGKHMVEERQYYESGALQVIIPPGKNGMEEGETIHYWENGKVKKIMPYHKDKLHGCAKEYYKNGKLHFEYNYKNGKRHGSCKCFHYNGNIKEILEYKNGKLNGTSKGFYSNGSLSYEYDYKNGLRNGYSISYKEKTGEIQLKEFFRNGELYDFYGNEGITGIRNLSFIKNEDKIKTVKTRKATPEEKAQYDNLLFSIVTNKERNALVVLVFNTETQKPPLVIEKSINDDAQKDLIKYAKSESFIFEDDKLLSALYEVELHDEIPKNLYHATAELISDIQRLKKYGIKQAIFLDDKIFVPNSDSSKTKEEKNTKKKSKKSKFQKKDFNLDFVNCSRDIKFITDKIIKSENLNFSICIHGEPGTGKSAYAMHLAEKLGLKVIKKSAADILDQYVGNSEQKIQEAFDEAEEKGAMLIIDEVDSFLRSRGLAQRNWEVTLVNQMLTSMENFNYPFVCTTNFIDMLDQASLRRFTFKFKFGFLKENKIKEAFEYIFKKEPNLKITKMNGLTVSDFISVKKECDILGITNINEIEKMLSETVALKESKDLSTNIGFN